MNPRKKIKLFLKAIVEMPVLFTAIGFWILAYLKFKEWFFRQNITARFVIVGIASILIFEVIKLFLREIKSIKSQWLRISVESRLEENREIGEDRIKALTSNIFSKKDIEKIHVRAEEIAKSWASDGEVLRVLLQLTSLENAIKKRAQVFIGSKLRKEVCLVNLPEGSRDIEECRGLEKYKLDKVPYPRIYSHNNWHEAISKVIETNASDIEKTDEAKLQISSNEDEVGCDGLEFDFYFRKNNREWTKKFALFTELNEIINLGDFRSRISLD